MDEGCHHRDGTYVISADKWHPLLAIFTERLMQDHVRVITKSEWIITVL